jgi:uncharacterized membrane protein
MISKSVYSSIVVRYLYLFNLWSVQIQGFFIPQTCIARRWYNVRSVLHSPFHSQSTLSSSHRFQSSFLHKSLISSDDPWGNWSALAGMATLAQIIGRKTRVGRWLGPPVSAMALTLVLASVGILSPGGTAASQSLQVLSLQLATPFLLMGGGANFGTIRQQVGLLLLESFTVASMATLLGCIIGWYVCGNLLTISMGKDGLIVAAALLAKNIGGGINYVAVCRSLSASPEAFAAGLCVDNFFGLLYFPISSILAAGRPDITTINSSEDSLQQHMEPTKSFISIQELTNVLWIGSTLVWLGEKVGGKSSALPMTTLLTILLTTLCPKPYVDSWKPASNLLGNCALYLFFATAGAPGIKLAESVQGALIPLSLFLTFLYSIHGLILITCCKWRRSSGAYAPQRLLVASSAAIGGPATAAALAEAMGWKSLLVPSLLIGNLGYAIATFLGIAYHRLLCPS